MFSLELSDVYALRSFEDGDADELHALIEANRAELMAWLPWAERQEPEATRAFIRMSRKQMADNDGLQAAILDRGRIVGCIGYHRIDWAHRATGIGYWLSTDAQGKGIMTLAVTALLDWAFTTWGLHRVEIRAAVGNRRSRAIPERLGFHEEGTLRHAEFVSGRYLDHVVYSMLADEWGSSTAVPSKAPARRSASAASARSSG
jgi:ribosomal-protein-serine acetyltransferase